MEKTGKLDPCTERHREIHRSALPLCCPMQNQEIWNAHPRVYLDVITHGEALCPYCGTTYTLVD